MRSSILITGALGYLGGRLVLGLHQAGYRVVCGTRRDLSSPPDWLPDIKMVRLDWNSLDSLGEACRGIDCVVHLSAMNEVESTKNPIGALQINGMQSLRLLEAAKKSSVQRFIYFSTAHVYGAPLEGHIDEKTLPRPIHPYAITHRVSEDFILAAHSQKLIEGVVVRLSNGFGCPATPNIDRWTLLVNDLCRQVVTTGELKLNTPGTQQRDFITLGDVVDATNHLILLESNLLYDGLFNLGGIQSISILEMAKLIANRWHKLSGVNPLIIRPDGNHIDSSPLVYDCNKLFSTGFSLSSLIESEIDATLLLCREAFGGG